MSSSSPPPTASRRNLVEQFGSTVQRNLEDLKQNFFEQINNLREDMKREYESRIREMGEQEEVAKELVQCLQERIEVLEEGKSPVDVNLRFPKSRSGRVHRTTTAVGNPKLPLELLSLVGQFLAGQNSFATLGNYSATCAVLHQEIQPILYEIVIVNEDNRDWLDSLSADSNARNAFRHTRYLIREKEHSRYNLFPNLKVEIVRRSRFNGGRSGRDEWPCTLHILKSVNVATLSTLMRIQLLWRTQQGTPWRGAISKISAVTIDDEAHIVANIPNDMKGLPSSSYTIATKITLAHLRASKSLRQTVSEVLWLLFSIESMQRQDGKRGTKEGEEPNLTFFTNRGFRFAQLIMETLEPIMAIGVCLPLSFRFLETSWFPNSDRLSEHMSEVARLYSRVWQRMTEDLDHNYFVPDEPIYKIVCNQHDGPDWVDAAITPLSSWEGFRLEIVHAEFDPDMDDDDLLMAEPDSTIIRDEFFHPAFESQGEGRRR